MLADEKFLLCRFLWLPVKWIFHISFNFFSKYNNVDTKGTGLNNADSYPLFIRAAKKRRVITWLKSEATQRFPFVKLLSLNEEGAWTARFRTRTGRPGTTTYRANKVTI